MNPSHVLFLAFLIGVISGLRSLTAPAVVAIAARLNWISLRGSPLSFMGSTAAVTVFAALAVGELIADKLPSTPSRLQPPGLIARFVLGGLSGASVGVAGGQSIVAGAILGAAGGIAGAFAGNRVRAGLVKAFKVPDFVIALLEDAAAIAGGLYIVSRF
jgi:uncharacterized membrane protein